MGCSTIPDAGDQGILHLGLEVESQLLYQIGMGANIWGRENDLGDIFRFKIVFFQKTCDHFSHMLRVAFA